jgi:signal transduction histidine kinase
MKTASVRTKLTLWNVGVLGLGLCLVGVGVFSGARASLLASVDKEMQHRAERQATRVSVFIKESRNRNQTGIVITGIAKGSNPKLMFPGLREPISTFQKGADTYETVPNTPSPPSNDPARPQFRPRNLDMGGKTMAGEGPYDPEAFKEASNGAQVFSERTIDNEPIRLFTTPVNVDGKIERVVQYPQPLRATYQALTGLTWTLFTVLPMVLLGATLGGFFLTGRALKPVREITRAAAEISAENLAGRLDVKGKDEFSGLATTFNGMLQRLQGAFTNMERAVERQRRFTADASHELRTPLTVIKANTSLALKSPRSPEEYQRSLTAINAAADSMGRLVNDLLLLARSDTGHLETRLEPVCLKPLLKEAIASVARPGVADIGLTMADEGTEVIADAHSILRLVVNLLENAARYTAPDGAITVDQSREESEIVITVTDTGIGIAPEHIPHLCDRFYRVDESRARAEGGNGLGLAICASIVEAHQGSMNIESVEGEGTMVTVRLPASA